MKGFNRKPVLDEVYNAPQNTPVAWMVFYDDDNEYATTVFTEKDALYYSGMAYKVYPLVRQHK